MNILKALLKQLFGAKYEHVVKSLAVCLILFLAVHAAEINMEIAPSVLILTATAFSAGIMWQAIHSSGNADRMAGLFMLPFAVLWCVAMLLSIFFVQELMVFAFLVLVSLLISSLRLLMADAYVFYHPVSAKLLIRHTKGTGSVLLYLLRYLITNKNYLLNTAGLCVVAGVLPLILGQFKGLNVMPLGFAILCLNTPICILLSCDPGLEQAVRVLPGQAGRFCICYSLFIFSVNMAVNSVYLVVWQIQHSGVGGMEIITVVLIALQSAILSVLLEWLHPIRNWKIESDLWHHPRKYIVPLIMLLIAGLIGMWPVSIWVLLCVVIAEVLSLLFITRRI